MITEDYLQVECYKWFHNTYPELRGLLCYNYNNSKNRIQGAMNKSKGLQAGRSDFVFYRNGIARMIELKVDGGKQSPDQKKWETLIKQNGFEYYVVWSLTEFQTLLKQWI